jgi:hypothetical protein
MPREIIHTDKTPASLGGYSQAVKAGILLFVAGQGPIRPQDRRSPGLVNPGADTAVPQACPGHLPCSRQQPRQGGQRDLHLG